MSVRRESCAEAVDDDLGACRSHKPSIMLNSCAIKSLNRGSKDRGSKLSLAFQARDAVVTPKRQYCRVRSLLVAFGIAVGILNPREGCEVVIFEGKLGD